MLAFGLVLPVSVECFAAAFGLSFLVERPGVWLKGWICIWAVAFGSWPVL
jgi:hypothetical protein